MPAPFSLPSGERGYAMRGVGASGDQVAEPTASVAAPTAAATAPGHGGGGGGGGASGHVGDGDFLQLTMHTRRKLAALKEFRVDGLITEVNYDRAKQELLGRFNVTAA